MLLRRGSILCLYCVHPHLEKENEKAETQSKVTCSWHSQCPNHHLPILIISLCSFWLPLVSSCISMSKGFVLLFSFSWNYSAWCSRAEVPRNELTASSPQPKLSLKLLSPIISRISLLIPQLWLPLGGIIQSCVSDTISPELPHKVKLKFRHPL